MKKISPRIIFGCVGIVCISVVIWIFLFHAPRTAVTVQEQQEEKKEQTTDVKIEQDQQQIAVQRESDASIEADVQPSTPVSPPSQQHFPTEAQKKEAETSIPSYENHYISWGYSTQGRKTIDTVIIHSSYNSLGGDPYDVDKILDIYRSYDVSAHYIIDRKGTIHRLVSEKNVSWHAGVSQTPDGRMDVNAFSIGIELVNDLQEAYTDEQYVALVMLLDDIRSRHAIRYVLGHDDIAPERKTDPWNFSWKRIGGKEK